MTGRVAGVVASLAMAVALAACGSASPASSSPPTGVWTPPVVVTRVPGLANSPQVAGGGNAVYVTWGPRDGSPLAAVRLGPDGRWMPPEIVPAQFGSFVTIGADLLGNAIVTWIEPQPGSDNVWCLGSATAGRSQAWGRRVILACDVGRGRVAVGPSGSATAVWTSRPTHALLAARYHPARGWTSAGSLTTGDRVDPLFDVAVDSDGRSLVAFEERPFPNADAAIAVGMADRDDPWVVRRIAELFPSQGAPQAAIEAGGFGVVAWQGGSGRGIVATRVSAVAANPVEITGDGDDQCPEVAGSGQGTSVIAWSRRRSRFGVFAAPGGNGRWEPEPIAPNHVLPPWCPQVAVDAAGNAAVAWEEGFTGVPPEVWASARPAVTGRWSEPLRLGVGAAHPAVAIADGVAYVVWVTASGDRIEESRLRFEP